MTQHLTKRSFAMFCIYCGKKLEQDVGVCNFCGMKQSSDPKTPVQEEPTQPQTPSLAVQQTTVTMPNPTPKSQTGKHLLLGTCGAVVGAILLAVILFVSGVFSSGTKKSEGPGFSSPEDAAEAYLSGLRDQDMDAMIAAFAIESYTDNYDLEVATDSLKAYLPLRINQFLPNTTEYTRQLNIEMRKNLIEGQIIFQYVVFNIPDAYNDLKTITFKDSQEVQDFIENIDHDARKYIFEDLVITGSLQPEELYEDYLSESNTKFIARRAEMFGVDSNDVANIAITFEADGETWVFCAQAIRYDNQWYLESAGGSLGSLLGCSIEAGGIMPYVSD